MYISQNKRYKKQQAARDIEIAAIAKEIETPARDIKMTAKGIEIETPARDTKVPAADIKIPARGIKMTKRDIDIAAREGVAKTMNGVLVQDRDGYWAIMLNKDWMKMRKRSYDASWASLDKNERAIELAAREAAAKAMHGVMVEDRSGYWGVVPRRDWSIMSNYDPDWYLVKRDDRLFNRDIHEKLNGKERAEKSE